MKPIVGIGEVLWDIFPDGHKVAGGAPFNFAFHCHQLGHEAAFVSRVGEDALGRELRERIRQLGLSDENIQTDRELPTGTVRVTVDQAGQPAYVIDTGAAWGNLQWTESLADLTRGAVALCHGTLALCGGASGRQAIATMAQGILQHNGITIYDVNLRGKYASRIDEDAVAWSSWLKVNDSELEELLRQNLRHENGLLIVTRGADGAEITGRDFHHREAAPPAKVIDTVGAGDAFTAALVCLHLEGRPLRECLRFATHYAARVCERQGATPHIERVEVEKAAFGK
jgi:fructokinase